MPETLPPPDADARAHSARLEALIRAEIAAQGMSVIAPMSGLTVEAVTRFLVGGFMEVLRSWMEAPDQRDASDLRERVTAAFDTVNALLTLPGRI